MENKITKEDMQNYIAENNQDVTIEADIFGKKIDLTIKRYCGIDDKQHIAEGVASFCFNEDGEFAPAVFEFAFRYTVALYCTNLFESVDGLDSEIVDAILFQTNIYEVIASHVDGLRQLRNSSLAYVEYKKNRSKWDDVADAIVEFVKGVRPLNDDDFANISKIAESFGKIDSKETIAKIIDYETLKGRIKEDKTNEVSPEADKTEK